MAAIDATGCGCFGYVEADCCESALGNRECCVLQGICQMATTRKRHCFAAAIQIHQEDVEANRRIGAIGAGLIRKQTSVITHCNAGALATGLCGTALGVIKCIFRGPDRSGLRR